MKRTKQMLSLIVAALLMSFLGVYGVSAADQPVATSPDAVVSEEDAPAIEVVQPMLDDVEINAEHFPDDAFRAYVAENFDSDGDGILSGLERGCVNVIDVTGTVDRSVSWEKNDFTYDVFPKVSDLTGIEYFPELLRLNCSYNKLKTLDVTKNPKLSILESNGNDITTLDLSQSAELVWLWVENCLLTELDVSACPKLTILSCKNGDFIWAAGGGGNFENKNQLTELDLTKNPELFYLYCTYNAIETLDLTGNPKLEALDCSANALTQLDLSTNTALKQACCSANPLTVLTLGTLPALTDLECYRGSLTELDVSGCAALETLGCAANAFQTLALRDNANLRILRCDMNRLTALDLSGAPNLVHVMCGENELTSIDVSMLKKLESLSIYFNKLTALDLSANIALTDLNCANNQLTSLNLHMLSDVFARIGNNTYTVVTPDGKIDLSTLPGSFDASKASDWVGGTVNGNTLTVADGVGEVTYTYQCGASIEESFKLRIVHWENPYTDVANDHPNIEAIAYVTQKGIFQGTDANNPTFSEDMVLTRAQFVTILGRLAEVDVTKYTAKVFPDVDPEKASHAWFAPYVAWASENGIVNGYGDGTFGPTDEINVEQAIAILARFARYQEKYSESAETLNGYEGTSDISNWALSDMQWAVENGLYAGEDGTLQPKALTDRMLTAILVYLYDATL